MGGHTTRLSCARHVKVFAAFLLASVAMADQVKVIAPINGSPFILDGDIKNGFSKYYEGSPKEQCVLFKSGSISPYSNPNGWALQIRPHRASDPQTLILL